jgi:hypothetical protein
MQYADFAYYRDTYKGTVLTEENADHYLQKASRDANTLTFSRIEGTGFAGLSLFRQESVREAVCRQAEFLMQNEDMLSTYLNEYSINGVSMKFGDSWNLHVENGVAMPEDAYQILLRTGLCYRGFMNYGW